MSRWRWLSCQGGNIYTCGFQICVVVLNRGKLLSLVGNYELEMWSISHFCKSFSSSSRLSIYLMWHEGQSRNLRDVTSPVWTWPPRFPVIHRLCISVTESEKEWIIYVLCLLQPVEHINKCFRYDWLCETYFCWHEKGFRYTSKHSCRFQFMLHKCFKYSLPWGRSCLSHVLISCLFFLLSILLCLTCHTVK